MDVCVVTVSGRERYFADLNSNFVTFAFAQIPLGKKGMTLSLPFAALG